jgi:hypothetical protein
MADETTPDALSKTSEDDISLTETQLDDVSGGWKISEDKKSSPVIDRAGNNYK